MTYLFNVLDLPVKLKEFSIFILFSLYQIMQYLCGYNAERNAVPAKAKRKVCIWPFGN